MVVCRESPRVQRSPDKNNAQWPPKSPFQALLSSPSGRQKWQDRQYRAGDRSPSPIPLRKPHTSRALQDLANMSGEDEDEEEDEETLQLRLQQIEAKLKLAKLRKAKKQPSEGADSGRESRQERAASPRKVDRPNLSPTRLYRAAVEVPVSPTRNARPPQEQLSPARQRLGLTSVTRAGDVSLKRARDGTQIKKSRSQSSLQTEQPRPKSFGERLAQSRQDEEEKAAKKDRLNQIRSSGFNHSRAATPTNGLGHQASSRASRSFDGKTRPSSSGRTDATAARSEENGVSRSASARSSRDKDHSHPKAKPINQGAYGQDSGTGHAEDDSDSSLHINDADGDSGYDPFSKIHLSKRHIQHAVVAREMEGKQIYNIPRLLKEVKAPHYDPPDCESDYVVFAVLASKSNPFEHAQSHKSADQVKEDFEAPRNKFMVFHLCDMKWEIDCFLFGTAFNQFWKLTPGTLLAILNPAILPPKGNQNNGRFSLKLGSSEDAVMEIGIARDLGYCSAIKKDGQQCGEWVDKRKTEACEFHISLQVEKNRKGRMEVNTMFTGGNIDDRSKSRIARENRGKGKGGPGPKFHREYGNLYSVNTGMGKSAASLLDKDDTDALHNMTQEEASRKRLADAQKERDLAKQLGEMGKGVGAEYMRKKHSSMTSTTTVTSTTSSRKQSAADEARDALFSKPSAADLGLLSKKSTDVHLSPAKDRKKHFGLGAAAMNSRSADPLGWGGARKAGLLQPKESRVGSPEKGQKRLDVGPAKLVRDQSQDSSLRSNGSSSPVKKRARFALEKGIRTPGRDSLPGNGNANGASLDDDDDDLDIV